MISATRRPTTRRPTSIPRSAMAIPAMAPRSFCRRACTALAVMLLLSLPSCGGDSPSTPTRPPTPPPGITFFPAVSPAPADSVSLERRSGTTTEITLAVKATSVEGLYGVALDIVYDRSIVELDSFEAGDFLTGAQGVLVSTNVVENPEGTLVIGQSRIGAVEGVTGTGDIVVLTFRAVGGGFLQLTPTSTGAFDADGAPKATTFLGGSLTVIR